eukprot:9468243-Pyramimonas_sp.AAC.1
MPLWGKGCSRAVSCDAAWTRARDRGRGYRMEDACELCLSTRGALRRRPWGCPARADLASELVPAEVQAWAAQAGDPLACHGLS